MNDLKKKLVGLKWVVTCMALLSTYIVVVLGVSLGNGGAVLCILLALLCIAVDSYARKQERGVAEADHKPNIT